MFLCHVSPFKCEKVWRFSYHHNMEFFLTEISALSRTLIFLLWMWKTLTHSLAGLPSPTHTQTHSFFLFLSNTHAQPLSLSPTLSQSIKFPLSKALSLSLNILQFALTWKSAEEWRRAAFLEVYGKTEIEIGKGRRRERERSHKEIKIDRQKASTTNKERKKCSNKIFK